MREPTEYIFTDDTGVIARCMRMEYEAIWFALINMPEESTPAAVAMYGDYQPVGKIRVSGVIAFQTFNNVKG